MQLVTLMDVRLFYNYKCPNIAHKIDDLLAILKLWWHNISGRKGKLNILKEVVT